MTRHLLYDCKRRTVCAEAVKITVGMYCMGLWIALGLEFDVAAAYWPPVSRMSLIFYVLNANSGR